MPLVVLALLLRASDKTRDAILSKDSSRVLTAPCGFYKPTFQSGEASVHTLLSLLSVREFLRRKMPSEHEV